MVYLDLVMGLNFIVDFLLLVSANRLAGYRGCIGRIILGASVGGIYSMACFLPGFMFLAEPLWRIVSLIVMGMISFGLNLSALQRGAVFTILSLAMGGLATAISVNDMRGIVSCGVLMWVLCRVSFRGKIGGREYVKVKLSYGEKNMCVTALKDTGNTLQDPLTGAPVLVAGSEIGAELLGIPEELLKKPAELVMSGLVPGMRLITYSSIGQSGGLLPVMRIKNVREDNTYSDRLVAFAAERIGKGEVYQMLTGGI